MAIRKVIFWLKKKKIESLSIENGLQRFAGLSSSTLLLYLLALGGTLLMLVPEQEAMIGFGYGLTGIINLVQVIPFIGMFFLLIFLFYLIKSWLNRDVRIFRKVIYSFVSLAGIGFIWFLNYWNLLGWRF